MTRWITISREKHANAHWTPSQGFDFARPLQVTDILIPELSSLLPQFALGFVQQQKDHFQPVALLGVGSGNLYVNAKGQWLGSYVPATLRGYPFMLAPKEDGGRNERVLCIADEYLGEGGADSQPLFNDEGKLADTAARAMDFLKQCEQFRAATAVATRALADARLLQRWPLKVNRGEDKEPLTLEKLYQIDEQRLNELDAETLANLRQSGALLLAYTQMLSMNQVDQLSQRARHLDQEREATAAGVGDMDPFDDSGSTGYEHLKQ